MIHVYALCYWILPYAQTTIDNMLENASEPLNITVVEGRSHNSSHFLDWAKDYLNQGKIQRFIRADQNCKGSGLLYAFDNYPPDNSEDFCIFTDLDLLVPKGCDWIGQTRQAMKVGAVSGFQLSSENYVSPNWGWHENEQSFGNWHMGIKINAVKSYPRQLSFQDHLMIGHAMNYGPRIQIKTRIYHQGWDAWKTDPKYWEAKLANMDWQSGSTIPTTYQTFTKENI